MRSCLIAVSCLLVVVGGLGGQEFVGKSAKIEEFLGKSAKIWIDELEKGEEAQRRSAAYALGKLQWAQAVPSLVARVREDKSAKVREAAAFSLGEIGQGHKGIADAKLVQALTDALKDGQPLVRRSAAFALGNLGKAAAASLKALENAVSDAKPEVRQNSAWALGQIGEEGIAGIRKALADSDTLVKRDAAAALTPLAEASPKAVRPALADLLKLCDKQEHVEVRKAAVGVLVKAVGPEDKKAAFTPLRNALTDADPEVAFNAALALSNIGGEETAVAVPILLDASRKGDTAQRRLAVAAFHNIGAEGLSNEQVKELVKELISRLSDADDVVREKAALSIGGMGAKAADAIVPLAQMVASAKERSAARIEAAVSLFHVSPRYDAKTDSAAPDKGDPEAVARAQARASAEKIVPQLLDILADPAHDAKVRERILWALRVHNVKLRDMKIYPALTKAMTEPLAADKKNKMLRYDCAYLLGMLQRGEVQKETMDVMLEYLKDDTIEEFASTTSSVGGSSQEGGSGKATSKEQGKGDGRKLALQSLHTIAKDNAAKISERRDIVEQLRLLAKDQNTTDEVRAGSKKILENLN